MILSYSNIIPYIANQLSWTVSFGDDINDFFTEGNYSIKESLDEASISKNRCFIIEDKDLLENSFFIKQPRNFIRENVRPVIREALFYQIVNEDSFEGIGMLSLNLPKLYDYNKNDIIIIFEFLNKVTDFAKIQFSDTDRIIFIKRVGYILHDIHAILKLNLQLFERFSPLFKDSKPIPLLEIDFNQIEFQARFQGDLVVFIDKVFEYPLWGDITRKAQSYFNNQKYLTLVHGDFKLSNMMTNYEKVFDDKVVDSNIYIIDWEFASFGNYLFDLATLYYYLLLGNKFDRQITSQKHSSLFQAFLEGYNIVHLTDEQKEMLNTFVLVRIIDFLIRGIDKKSLEDKCISKLKGIIIDINNSPIFI